METKLYTVRLILVTGDFVEASTSKPEIFVELCDKIRDTAIKGDAFSIGEISGQAEMRFKDHLIDEVFMNIVIGIKIV